MRLTCELCRNFCSELHDLRIDATGLLIGRIGPCCQASAPQRLERLRSQHPERCQGPLSMAEFRALTRVPRSPSPNRFGRPRRDPEI